MNPMCQNSPDLIEISDDEDDEIMQNHDQNLHQDWGLRALVAHQ